MQEEEPQVEEKQSTSSEDLQKIQAYGDQVSIPDDSSTQSEVHAEKEQTYSLALHQKKTIHILKGPNFVAIPLNILRNVRDKLGNIANEGFLWHDLLLGTATLSLGSTLSAVLTKVPLSSTLGVVFFIGAPILAAICGTFYVVKRHELSASTTYMAEEALNELPGPDNLPDEHIQK